MVGVPGSNPGKGRSFFYFLLRWWTKYTTYCLCIFMAEDHGLLLNSIRISLVSILSPKYQSKMTNPLFFLICIRDVIQVEQKCYACCKKWYTSILLHNYFWDYLTIFGLVGNFNSSSLTRFKYNIFLGWSAKRDYLRGPSGRWCIARLPSDGCGERSGFVVQSRRRLSSYFDSRIQTSFSRWQSHTGKFIE